VLRKEGPLGHSFFRNRGRVDKEGLHAPVLSLSHFVMLIQVFGCFECPMPTGHGPTQ
jgi:hypothetical protein